MNRLVRRRIYCSVSFDCCGSIWDDRNNSIVRVCWTGPSRSFGSTASRTRQSSTWNKRPASTSRACIRSSKIRRTSFLPALSATPKLRGAEILTSQPLGWGNIERFLRLGFGCDDNQRGCFAVNSMRELAVLPTEAQEIISSSQRKLTRLLIKNIEAEEPKLDASMIADVVLTFFHGFCIAQNLKSGKASSERKIRNLMQVVRNL